MLRTDPLDPMLSTDPVEPMDRIDPDDPIEKALPTLRTLTKDNADSTDHADMALLQESFETQDCLYATALTTEPSPTRHA